MEGVRLAQTHIGLHKLLDGWAEGAEIALQDPGTALVLGLKLGRHGGAVWREREPTDEERKDEEV